MCEIKSGAVFGAAFFLSDVDHPVYFRAMSPDHINNDLCSLLDLNNIIPTI
jgi:hypothetical protein